MVVAAPFGPGGPSTTVIVATYDQPRELQLILAALSAQEELRFDVIVADDGSDPPAARLLERLAPTLPFPIDSVWQEDDGFRKAAIQNRAALATRSELLIFLDGDCLPARSLLGRYRRAARRGEFLVGGVGLLDPATSASLTPEEVAQGRHEAALAASERWRMRRIHLSNRLHAAWPRKLTRPRIRGGNFAVCAALFREVDGYDEVYCGHGKEDSDLRNRMRNAGARGISLWHRAWACHLAREVSASRSRGTIAPEVYAEGRRRVRARQGLSGHPDAR